MSGMNGANEVIAATNEDSLAPGVSRLSFTSVLTRVLENFAERHRKENIQWTAVTLASHLRSYYYPQELQKAPQYMPGPDYPFESCLLIPLRHSGFHFLGGTLSQVHSVPDPTTVLVAISLGTHLAVMSSHGCKVKERHPAI
jgi:hypothetical protein